jgi:hypothetical protein
VTGSATFDQQIINGSLSVLIIVIGLLLLVGGKIPWIGRLPGDIIIKKEKFSFYFPITTSILISILLTFLFWLF